MITPFNEFIKNIIVENLHPEIQDIIKANKRSRQRDLAKKIKELSDRGEKTGIEGNMPKGSSRAYLKHEDHEDVHIDGQPHKIKVGTKISIRGTLDAHHNPHNHDGMSLGQLQNKAENDDHWVNNSYRILTKDHDHEGHFHSNKDRGIFPPLLDHDDKEHTWSKVGHIADMKKSDFPKLTKTESHPKGITHEDFVNALVRDHNLNHGKHWRESPETESHLDHVREHPLVEKFNDYHGNTGNPPHDYAQIKNLGVFHHPDGSKHIIARDHGYNSEVQEAYTNAFSRKAHSARNRW